MPQGMSAYGGLEPVAGAIFWSIEWLLQIRFQSFSFDRI